MSVMSESERRSSARDLRTQGIIKEEANMRNSIVPLSLLIIGLFMASPAQAQNVCPAGMPCILSVYNVRANLVVEWNDTENRDHYNFSWSRPGKSAVHSERPGGSRGRFILKNFHPNTKYTFAVQGCRKPLIGRS